MSEEKQGTPKNKWSRIFRKKWFFPALYLTIAALLLAVVVWYQNLDNQVPSADEEVQDEQVTDNYEPTPDGEEAQPVLDQQETIKFPLTDPDQAEIVTKFYDYNASEEDQENALVFYNNRYYQSTGVDFASEEPFEVQASLSGTVTEVKEDPLLGNVVILSHENDVTTYYASLGEVAVTAGDEVKQGDQLGTAGKNIFGKDNGTHVHFELRKGDKGVNPESFFNQPVSALDELEGEEVSEESEGSEESAASEEAESEEASEPTDSENVTDEESTDETEESADEEETDSDKEEEDSSDNS
ncbi:M23 family metallopeptidase [Oceanobacillus halophilus]|uniref:M23 family metallopeptidase n=1 Tax=Oceanobacillus halophilus TaxID=930130 RepID=A0A495A4C5_9BACI|nr:M23 family metallopeptidase [Oceanobacillus halophilus]RKQ34357.1 M23 family metallopeptidase [Oceanobacillus halophilus]